MFELDGLKIFIPRLGSVAIFGFDSCTFAKSPAKYSLLNCMPTFARKEVETAQSISFVVHLPRAEAQNGELLRSLRPQGALPVGAGRPVLLRMAILCVVLASLPFPRKNFTLF